MRTKRTRIGLAIVVATLAAACSSGPDAPPAAAGEEVCTETFCILVPDGWTYEVADTYISAAHDVAPDTTFLTAGVINMQAIVESAGGTWPVPTADVSRSFWTLLENAGAGEFTRSARMVGGAERSWGSHTDGDMWHMVHPTGPTSAIGIEIRAPNGTWESHADTVFESLRLTSGSA